MSSRWIWTLQKKNNGICTVTHLERFCKSSRYRSVISSSTDTVTTGIKGCCCFCESSDSFARSLLPTAGGVAPDGTRSFCWWFIGERMQTLKMWNWNFLQSKSIIWIKVCASANKFTNLLHFFFTTLCWELWHVNILAHIEPQTATNLSVLTIKLC